MGIFSPEEPEHITLHDKTLHCLVCEHDKFFPRKGQMQTAGLAFMNLDWAAPTCTCLICAECGYVHWFVPKK